MTVPGTWVKCIQGNWEFLVCYCLMALWHQKRKKLIRLFYKEKQQMFAFHFTLTYKSYLWDSFPFFCSNVSKHFSSYFSTEEFPLLRYCPNMKSLLEQHRQVTNTEIHLAQQQSVQSTICVTMLKDTVLLLGEKDEYQNCCAHLVWACQPLQHTLHTPHKWLFSSGVQWQTLSV